MKNEYIIEGEVAKIKIVRKNGDVFWVLIDTEDIDRVKSLKSNLSIRSVQHLYARYHEKCVSKPLHRFLLNAPENMLVDHVNHNTLDNRKSNLRLVTPKQNQENRQSTKSSSSKYLGVYWAKRYKHWRAAIQHYGQFIHIGCFSSEEEAARAYDKKAMELFTCPNLNFRQN